MSSEYKLLFNNSTGAMYLKRNNNKIDLQEQDDELINLIKKYIKLKDDQNKKDLPENFNEEEVELKFDNYFRDMIKNKENKENMNQYIKQLLKKEDSKNSNNYKNNNLDYDEKKQSEFKSENDKIKHFHPQNCSLFQNNQENIVEIDTQEFFKNFTHISNLNSKENPQVSYIEGPRGFPGLIGPQGPPGPIGPRGIQGESISKEDILELIEQVYPKFKMNMGTPLLFGIKRINITETNKIVKNSNFRIGFNKQENNQEILYDTFYLSPNILELIQHDHDNYIHEHSMIRVHNIYNKQEDEIFPLNYSPSGFPIELKTGTLIIENIRWNLIQNLTDSLFEELNIRGVVPLENEFKYINIDLELSFELHSLMPYHLINNRESLFPYRLTNQYNQYCASNTCLFSSELTKIKLSSLNEISSTIIKFKTQKHPFIHNVLLCVKVGVSNDSLYQLQGFDKYKNTAYGYIPFSQFILSCDYKYE